MSIFSLKGATLLILLALAAALFVSEINSNPFLFVFNAQNVGSFEYVRIGEKLFDKGLYEKAVGFYEKAYESSPQNALISSDLIFVYSKYALTLSESGKYDEAIKYLTKAYNIRQDSSTTQNLAIMYAARALELAQKGDSPKAAGLFKDARAIAYGSHNAAKNLGISLFNDGVNEFNKGRENIALLCLKESSLTYQNSRTFSLIADIYYKVGELKRARFYWRRAKILDPGNDAISARIKKVTKEIKLQSNQKEIELPHFEVKYKEGLPIDALLTSEILEKAYFDIGKDLAYFPKTKTGVFLYSSADFRNIFKMPTAVRAFYDGNIRMPVPDRISDSEEYLRHIYHEYTHALLSAKTANSCPVWLAEGIATWEEFSKSGRDISKLSVDARMVSDITLESLDKEFQNNEINLSRGAYYLLSYTVVEYIIDNWGLAGLQDILKRISDGQHVVNAIDDEFLLSEKEFERKWKLYVRNRYPAK